ncbi:MAG: ATP-binding cassette domain-containing protein [bacterium]|nr:ATP-binding cassette domain-containing protein [bacterium]
MTNISKAYPGVQALKNVSLELAEGEVHALVGENGAGKSTLMKILAGAERADSGEIEIGGEPVVIDSPLRAREAGVSLIYQEFNLVPHLNAAENIFLGREPVRMGFVRFAEQRRLASELLDGLGAQVDPRAPVSSLSVAQQQMVEIAKALSINARVIAMDEPSAALTTHEMRNLFQLIRGLKSRGVSVIYISHRLEEIFEICDRLTVLRDGEWIGTWPVSEMSRESVIEKMVGRKITDEFPKERFEPGEELLRVEGLTRGFVKDVSFSVRRGEVAALTGLVGAGRTETARMIFAADRPESGCVYLKDERVSLRNPREAIRRGICLLTEDRKGQGLVLGMKIRENATLPTLERFSNALFIRRAHENAAVGEQMSGLRIKAPSAEVAASALSGGNQQKVVLAKWMLANAELFIFDEPTRGVDVGAKREIYLLMNELLRRGAAILMISSELPEVLGMADRILVMSEGRLVGEMNAAGATQESIMELAVASKNRAA